MQKKESVKLQTSNLKLSSQGSEKKKKKNEKEGKKLMGLIGKHEVKQHMTYMN